MSDEPQSHDTILLMGLIVFCLVIAAWVLVSILGATRTTQISQLDKKIDGLNKNLAQADIAQTEDTYLALNTAISHMTQLRAKRFVFLPVWNGVKASVPRDMQFVSLSMGNTNDFQISGITKSVGSVSYFAKALAAKPDFHDVTPLSVQSQKDQGVYNFNLTFSTKPVSTSSKDTDE